MQKITGLAGDARRKKRFENPNESSDKKKWRALVDDNHCINIFVDIGNQGLDGSENSDSLAGGRSCLVARHGNLQVRAGRTVMVGDVVGNPAGSIITFASMAVG